MLLHFICSLIGHTPLVLNDDGIPTGIVVMDDHANALVTLHLCARCRVVWWERSASSDLPAAVGGIGHPRVTQVISIMARRARESGQGLTEYALLTALVAIVAIIVISLLGLWPMHVFGQMAEALREALQGN